MAAAAVAAAMEMCMENLEVYVCDESKTVRWIALRRTRLNTLPGWQVTYKWLSSELSIPANSAKR